MRYRIPLRKKKAAKQAILSGVSLPAPVGGWNTRDPISSMGPKFAQALDNMWPTPGDVQARLGAADHVTDFPATVKTLACWRSTSGQEKLFGITDGGVYDATVAGTVGASVQARTNGQCVPLNYITTGGSFLFLVNGTDQLVYYNGTTWTSVASFSINGGGTLATTAISNISSFKRMLFFIENNSMNFYYLPTDSIAGTVNRYPLGAIFSKGGQLVAAANWTIDGGEGADDYCVFATSKGQIAVFKGTDPSSSATWGLQGVYNLGEPLGKRCFIQYAGDVLYLSALGLEPMSQALQSTKVTNRSAVSDTIGPSFADAAASYGALYGWQGIVVPSSTLLLVNVPTVSFAGAQQFAMNTSHNAWARFTGWNATSFELMARQLYMATGTKVAKAWYGTSDFGVAIPLYCRGAFSYLNSRGRSKHIRLIRPVFKTEGQLSFDIGMDVDFSEGTDYTSSSLAQAAGGVWDTAIWDSDVWAAGAQTKQEWLTAEASPGYAFALRLRLNLKDATIRWSSTDIGYELGSVLG